MIVKDIPKPVLLLSTRSTVPGTCSTGTFQSFLKSEHDLPVLLVPGRVVLKALGLVVQVVHFLLNYVKIDAF